MPEHFNHRFEDERDFSADDNYDFRPQLISTPRPRVTPLPRQMAHVGRMVQAREPVEVRVDPDPYEDAEPRSAGTDEDEWCQQSTRPRGK